MLWVLLLLLFTFSHSQITFVGTDGDWEKGSNWDVGVEPDSSQIVILNFVSITLPPSPLFREIQCTSCQIYIPQNITIDGNITLDYDSIMNVSGTVQGNGKVSGGVLNIVGGLMHIPVVGPVQITFFYMSYIDYVELVDQYALILGGSFEYESIGTLFVNNNPLGDISLLSNLTVRELVLRQSPIHINLRVTGRSTFNGDSIFYGVAIFDGPVEWLDGVVKVFENVMEVHGDIVCLDTINGCTLTTHSVGKRALSGIQILFIYGGLYGPGTMYLWTSNTYIIYLYGPINANISCGESATYFEYSYRINVVSGDLCNMFFNVPIELPVLSFSGSLSSLYDVPIGTFYTTGASFNGGTYYINTAFTLEGGLTLNHAHMTVNSTAISNTLSVCSMLFYNSTFIFGADIVWNGEITLDSDSVFSNYGYIRFLETGSGVIDVNSGSFINYGTMEYRLSIYGNSISNSFGSFVNYGTMTFDAPLLDSPSFYVNGEFLNSGAMYAYSNNFTFDFQYMSNDLYQCTQSIYQINVQQGIASQMALNENATINGVFQFNFQTMEDYIALSSSGIVFAKWPTKMINNNPFPLSGNILAMVQIFDSQTYLTGFICQDISGPQSYARFYTHNAPLNAATCVPFDKSLISDNEKCVSMFNFTWPSPSPSYQSPSPPSQTPSPAPFSLSPAPEASCNGTAIGTCIDGTWVIINSSLDSTVHLMGGHYLIIRDVGHSSQLFFSHALATVQGALELSGGTLSLSSGNLNTQDLIIINSTLSLDPFSKIVVSGNFYIDNSTIIMDYLNLNIRDELIPITYSNNSHIGHYIFLSKNVVPQPDCSQPHAVTHDTHLAVFFDTNSCPNQSVSEVVGGVVGGILGALVLVAILIYFGFSYLQKKKLEAFRKKVSKQANL